LEILLAENGFAGESGAMFRLESRVPQRRRFGIERIAVDAKAQ
jgi:hypothetical protein